MLNQWRAFLLTLAGIVIAILGIVFSGELMSFGILVTIGGFTWLADEWLKTPTAPEREPNV